MTAILDRCGKAALIEYLAECATVCDLSPEIALTVTQACCRQHDGREVDDVSMSQMLELQRRWYASLETRQPDYSVYADPYYFCEVWLCWVKYSRIYLKAIEQDRLAYHDPRSIMDLGCGFGYTTAALKNIFPDAVVAGTNLPDSAQWRLASKLATQHNFEVLDGTVGRHVDLVFASEYFEHFESPIDHLRTVLSLYTPSTLIVANTFSGYAIGHFLEYRTPSGSYIPGKSMSRVFNATLRDAGYSQRQHGYWNNRPMVWVKRDCEILEKFFI